MSGALTRLNEPRQALEGEWLPAGALRRAERGGVVSTIHLRIEVGDVGLLLHAFDVAAWHPLAELLPLDEPAFVAIVSVNGVVVPRNWWRSVRPKPGARVVVRIIPQGGDKGLFRQIAFLAIAVGATIISGGALAPVLGGAFAAGSFGAAAAAVAFSTVAGMAANALLPPPKQPPPSFTQAKQKASISGGTNQLNRYGRKTAVLGTHIVTPDLGGSYVTEIVGDEQYLRMYLIVGNGPLAIDQITFETTPIDAYEGVEAEIREGWPDDEPLTLYTRLVSEEQLGVVLNDGGASAVRTNKANTAETTLEFTASGGLARYEQDGTGLNRVKVIFLVEQRPASGGTWSTVRDFEAIGPVKPGGVDMSDNGPLDGSFTVNGKTTSLLRFGIRIRHTPSAQFDFRVTRRETMESTSYNDVIASDSERTSSRVGWTILRSVADEDEPLSRSDVPQAKIALRIKASGELGNTVPVVRCRARSYVPVWDGSAWPMQLSNSPAYLFRHAYTSRAITPKPVDVSEMDDETLIDWADDCRLLGLTFNALVREDTHLELTNQIAAVGRASRYRRGDMYSVVRDLPQSGSVQLFSDRNSWDHSIDAALTKMPHALRVKYDDPGNGGENEVLVYRAGYDASNATEFEVFDVTYGVDTPEQAHKAGRYWFADRILRPENGRLTTDMRSIRCQRGDLIDVQMTIALIGQSSARVLQVFSDEDDRAVALVLDSAMIVEDSRPYGVRIQTADGATISRAVTNEPGIHTRLDLATPADGVGPESHVAFGEAEHETIQAIVRSLHRQKGVRLFGIIEWVPAAPEIHDLEDGPIPDYDPNISAPADLGRIAPEVPRVDRVASDESVLVRASDGSLAPRIVVYYQRVSSDRPSVARVAVRYRVAGDTTWQTVADRPTGLLAIDGVRQGERYELQIGAASIYGGQTEWTPLADHIVVGKSTPPPDVKNLRATREVSAVRIEWDAPGVPDVADTRVEMQVGDSWQLLGFVDGTVFTIDVQPAESYNFRARHRDTNVTPLLSAEWVETTLVVDQPPAVSLAYRFDGPDLVLSWTAEVGAWPLREYRVYREGALVDSPKAGQWRTRVDWRDPESFGVTQVDTAGNESTMASLSVAVSPPVLTAIAAQTFVNRALLAWRIVPGSLPVERTRILAGESLEAAAERATSDTNATFVEESEAGEYSYWLVPQDSAGIDGQADRQVVTLSAPAGFILRNRFTSDFSGTRTHMLLSDGPRLLAPVDSDESISEHFDSRGWTSPADQIAAGFPRYLQPTPDSGEYIETFDTGAVIPASGVKVTLRSRVVAGTASASVQISVRETASDAWNDFPEGQAQIFASAFRYVQVRVTVTTPDTQGLLAIDGLTTEVSTQELRESGRGQMAGNPTRIDLTKPFVDITHVSADAIGADPNIKVLAINDYDTAHPTFINFEAYDLRDGSVYTGPFSYSVDGT